MSAVTGKILVIRGGAIGDFILTLPVLAALRGQFPQARIELLAYRGVAELAVTGGLADAARSIEARPLAGFFARGGVLDAELREYFASFAIIVSYLFDPEEIFQTNVRSCTRAQFLVGPHRPPEREGLRHATEVFLQPLARLAIFEADPTPRLVLAERPPRPGPCVALHPGSGGEHKNWPESKWAELIQHLLHTTEHHLLLVGGEAEGGRLTRLAQSATEFPASRLRLAQSLPLTELAGELSGCAAFVGHDSGITHLAAALGLPGVVLWGPTLDTVWRPRSERMILLKEPAGLRQLATAKVAATLDEILRR